LTGLKNKTQPFVAYKKHPTGKDTYKLKVKDGKSFSMQMELKRNQDLITDKADLKLKLVRKDKESYFILIKRTIHRRI
jgi:hypothetical protein